MSGAVIAEIEPARLPAPLAGAVTGRLPRGVGHGPRGPVAYRPGGILPLVDHHLAAVYAAGFGLPAGAVFFNPAACVLPAIVDEQELVAASSGLWPAAVASQVALAPLGGALVAASGVAPAF